MLSRFRDRRRRRDSAAALYDAIVEQARRPAFYEVFGVPDTMLCRYEMICLHAFMVFRRLGRLPAEGQALSQSVHDRMFMDFDRTLREAGIGDMGIGKRIKNLARNLYGRIAAYERGLAAGRAELAAALRRNLYATAAPADGEVEAMAAYVAEALAALDRVDDASLMAGAISFPAPAAPAIPAEASR